MKQTALMLLLLAIGTIGSFVKGPFYGIAIYYLFAVLRPQYLWQWAINIDISWSFYVAIAAIIACFFQPKIIQKNSEIHIATVFMMLFALWLSLSSFFALNTSIAYPHYVEYLKIFVMFFLSLRVINTVDQIKCLYLIAFIAIGYIAFEMNALYFQNGRVDIYTVGYGGLDNNGAGLMIAMGLPLAYFLWQGAKNWVKWLALGSIPLILHAVLMSYSRGAMLSLLLVSPFFFMRSKNKKVMIVAMIGIMFLVPILAGPEIRERFFTIDDYQSDESANLRFESWKAAFEIAKDYPVVGAGIRNSDILSYQYGADRQGRTIHSLYLQMVADSGFPALGFYLLILFFTWRSLREFQKKISHLGDNESELFYNLACGLEVSMAVFCIGAAFLSLETFELPYLLILLALKLPMLYMPDVNSVKT